MTTEPGHDQLLHYSFFEDGDRSFTPGCPPCEVRHRRQGRRLLLLLLLGVVGLLVVAALLLEGPLATLLALSAWVLLAVPLPPLSRWLSAPGPEGT